MPEAPTLLEYVILRHEGIADPHFDLMFETAPKSKLATWRAETWPLTSGAILTRIADHRREYLQFEGELTGARGTVRRIERGQYQLLNHSPADFRAKLPGISSTLDLQPQSHSPPKWICLFE